MTWSFVCSFKPILGIRAQPFSPSKAKLYLKFRIDPLLELSHIFVSYVFFFHFKIVSLRNALWSHSFTISIQTVSELIEVSNVKQEKSEAISEEKKKSIPCKYFHKTKGCRRGEKCWFYHDYNPRVDKKSTKLQQKFKVKPKKDKELKQEQCASLEQVILELLKLLLRESDT